MSAEEWETISAELPAIGGDTLRFVLDKNQGPAVYRLQRRALTAEEKQPARVLELELEAVGA